MVIIHLPFHIYCGSRAHIHAVVFRRLYSRGCIHAVDVCRCTKCAYAWASYFSRTPYSMKTSPLLCPRYYPLINHYPLKNHYPPKDRSIAISSGAGKGEVVTRRLARRRGTWVPSSPPRTEWMGSEFKFVQLARPGPCELYEGKPEARALRTTRKARASPSPYPTHPRGGELGSPGPAGSESLVFGGCAFPPVSLGPAGDCPCKD